MHCGTFIHVPCNHFLRCANSIGTPNMLAEGKWSCACAMVQQKKVRIGPASLLACAAVCEENVGVDHL